MTGFERTLVEGLAALVAAEVPGVTARPSGTYQAAEIGVYADALPVNPDRGIAVTIYLVDSNSGHTTATVGAQFRVRGRPGNRADVKTLTDALFDVLDNRTGYDLGGIPVVRSWLQSGVDLAPDGNDRQIRTANYYITLTRPSRHRQD